MADDKHKIRRVGAKGNAGDADTKAPERADGAAGKQPPVKNEAPAGTAHANKPLNAVRRTAEPSASAKHAADVAHAHQLERERAQRAAEEQGYIRQESAAKNDAHAPDEAAAKEAGPPENTDAGKDEVFYEKKKGLSRTKKIVLLSILGVLVIGIGAGWIYINKLRGDPGAAFRTDDTLTLEATPAPTPNVQALSTEPTAEPTVDLEEELLGLADLAFMKNRANILVLGLDESTERENWGSFRTDTMILISVNFDTRDVDMISVPRDSYVKICNGEGKPTGSYGKINSAFPSGGGAQKNGYAYAMGTVSYLLGGIPIDYYVGFNMNVVKEVVDAMGGVDYEVDIEVKMNGRELHPGYQHLDGQAVLDYCRQRKGSSDIARVERQQNMLMAIFRQMKSAGQILNIPSIYNAVSANMQTNLDFSQIASLALMANDMGLDQLGKHVVGGEFMDINDTSYWGVHTATLQSLVKELFGVDVRIDGDISASNVRKRVEESQALIAGELGAAKSAVSTANNIISQYGSWIDSGTLSRLQDAISQVEDAIEDQDKALLETTTAALRSLNSAILAKLQEAGADVSGASGTLDAATPDTPDIPVVPEEQYIPEVPAA